MDDRESHAEEDPGPHNETFDEDDFTSCHCEDEEFSPIVAEVWTRIWTVIRNFITIDMKRLRGFRHDRLIKCSKNQTILEIATSQNRLKRLWNWALNLEDEDETHQKKLSEDLQCEGAHSLHQSDLTIIEEYGPWEIGGEELGGREGSTERELTPEEPGGNRSTARVATPAEWSLALTDQEAGKVGPAKDRWDWKKGGLGSAWWWCLVSLRSGWLEKCGKCCLRANVLTFDR